MASGPTKAIPPHDVEEQRAVYRCGDAFLTLAERSRASHSHRWQVTTATLRFQDSQESCGVRTVLGLLLFLAGSLAQGSG